MTSTPKIEDALRAKIIATPDVILDDKDVMRALVAANEKIMGDNIVDLRGIAMDRLESRLDRLEDTHRSVIAAAYENVAGTNQIHRAILRILEADSLPDLLAHLQGDVGETLRVDAIRLVLESDQNDSGPPPAAAENGMLRAPSGYIDGYVTQGRGGISRQVTLRRVDHGDADLFGQDAAQIRSEACLKLDLGTQRLPGLVVLGSQDAEMFGPQQGTDLLVFFTGVLERTLRRWVT
ncbi:DUF484 domain-containing protein [Roseobacter denitrificans]|uniref:Recombinase XerC n=1 Tax=Roseobacter denitrificans (strain ATCC 33942 / OCh 114) TaxID=375451 RepID=Q168B2_ROSDO|nr:DUF484 family protein [Roseobacter denitrificans]ABG31681.1 conserved hypothetical protein [Roseobacter denitrificans OCh 114]AVL54648.1 DUF484 domain-containing protein [Roseobacter denitrificans]SFF88408.1 hypothetical protein SAMN05443635_103151 [Roseobacter denitrificans OCh 114]